MHEGRLVARLLEQCYMHHRSQKVALTLVSRSRAQRGPSRAQENSFASCGAKTRVSVHATFQALKWLANVSRWTAGTVQCLQSCWPAEALG
jgi:hypothetical protein